MLFTFVLDRLYGMNEPLFPAAADPAQYPCVREV